MPHRNHTLKLIETYTPQTPYDTAVKFHIQKFLEHEEKCFERENLPGHVTASSFVVNPERTHTLLMHHKKLNEWVQFGGHCDGDTDVLYVATKELEEESGIRNAKLVTPKIFDIAIPHVPQHKNVPAHLHYDIRFLFEVPFDATIVKQEEEVNDIQWFTLDEAKKYQHFL